MHKHTCTDTCADTRDRSQITKGHWKCLKESMSLQAPQETRQQRSILPEWNQDLSMVETALSEDEANRLGTEVTPESALTS